MYAENKHYSEEFLSGKKRKTVDNESPLCLMVSKKTCFLCTTAEILLNANGYSVIVKEMEGQKWNDYTLPVLCYESFILSRQQLVNFLCDCSLGYILFNEYFQRKENIILFCSRFYRLRQLESELNLHNSTVDGLSVFRTSIEENAALLFTEAMRLLEKDKIEALFVSDAILSILEEDATPIAEYILRGYYEFLIDIAKKQKTKWEKCPLLPVQVILEMREEPEEQEITKYKGNFKVTTIISIFVMLVYFKWVK